jgi:hypothetical protein
VVGADSLFYVGSGGALLAISFTGNTRWSVVLAEARFQSPPVLLLDGTAFIMYDKGYLLRLNDTTRLSSGLPSGSYMRQVGVGKDGTIYAVGGANGTLCAVHGSSFLWSRMAPGGGSFNGNGMAGIVISPDGNTIYVPAGLRPSLVALDVNGSVLWSDTLVGGVMGVPAVDNAGNLFLWTRDSLTSLSPFGKRRWALFTGSGNWDLTIDCLGNIAYLAQGYLCSVQNNGKPRWKVKVDDADFFTSLVSDADGTVYCVTGSSGITNYNVRAVSLNGAVKWVLPISAYMKLGGLALTKEGYLLITDTGIDAGTVNSVFVIE